MLLFSVFQIQTFVFHQCAPFVPKFGHIYGTNSARVEIIAHIIAFGSNMIFILMLCLY